MITLKVEQMLNAIPALNELVDAEINVVSAFKIARLTADINQEIEAFVKARDSMAEEIDMENDEEKAEALVQMETLFNEEVELNHDQITAESLGTRAVLKPIILMSLDWLFVQEEKAAK